MIKIFYVLQILLLLTVSSISKEKTKNNNDLYRPAWQKTYGGSDKDVAKSVIALEDGDSVVVGSCKSFDANRTDICLIRIDQNGAVKWRRFLGGKKVDEGGALSRSLDGNLLVVGESKSYSSNYDTDLLVAKVSLEGKVLWMHTMGGPRNENYGGIVGTDDGGALVVGSSSSFGSGDKDIYIVKIDSNGKVISENTIGGKKDDVANALTRTKDGNIVMVGYRELKRSGSSNFFIMKLNQNGKKIWAKTYGGENADVLMAVAPTMDGGVVVTGKTRSFGSKQSDLSVMKFGEEGQLIWHKIYGFKYYEYGNAIVSTKNGDIWVAGGTNTLGKGGHDMYILVLGKNGTLMWSHTYGDEDKDIAHGVAMLSNGSLLIVGESNSYGLSTNFYMVNLKK